MFLFIFFQVISRYFDSSEYKIFIWVLCSKNRLFEFFTPHNFSGTNFNGGVDKSICLSFEFVIPSYIGIAGISGLGVLSKSLVFISGSFDGGSFRTQFARWKKVRYYITSPCSCRLFISWPSISTFYTRNSFTSILWDIPEGFPV